MNTSVDHSMLRSIKKMRGSMLRASDGEICHVTGLRPTPHPQNAVQIRFTLAKQKTEQRV